MTTPSTALHLYRKLLRASTHMPTENRDLFVKKAARRAFEDARAAAALDIPALLQLGEFQLETVQAQAEHLTKLQAEGNLKS